MTTNRSEHKEQVSSKIDLERTCHSLKEDNSEKQNVTLFFNQEIARGLAPRLAIKCGWTCTVNEMLSC